MSYSEGLYLGSITKTFLIRSSAKGAIQEGNSILIFLILILVYSSTYFASYYLSLGEKGDYPEDNS